MADGRHAPRGRQAAADFPALILTGPRRAGKTALLEDPETIGRFRLDPRAFLEGLRPPVILDEIQNAPELFRWVRADIDRRRSRRARWLITGSQEAPLMQGVTESMAGRAAVFQLLPLAVAETPRVSLLKGGFPEVLARPATWRTWYRSYVQTYLERDVRAVTAVRDLATFRRLLALLASRRGQVLNKTDLAAPLGVSVPTITQWLSVLETIESERELTRSPFHGALFEGFVAAKTSNTLRPEMADPMLRLAAVIRSETVRCLLVHRRWPTSLRTSALKPGVEAMDLTDLPALFRRS